MVNGPYDDQTSIVTSIPFDPLVCIFVVSVYIVIRLQLMIIGIVNQYFVPSLYVNKQL